MENKKAGIDPRSLMLGNWIFNKEKNKPVQVGYLSFNAIHADVALFNEAFEPIELSPEILEKAGFEINEFGYRVKDGIKIYWDGMKSFQFNYDHNDEYRILEIIYLHQLQNLYYSLTSTDLKINM